MQATLNRNKRSLTLDLHAPRGREIFLDLCGRADIVIENFRPGALDGWGVGWKELRARKHDLILVSISGFGQYGRDHDRAGYDPLAQAASGFPSAPETRRTSTAALSGRAASTARIPTIRKSPNRARSRSSTPRR